MTRFNPVTNEIENWKEQFDSGFTQLGGRVCCLGDNGLHIEKKRCTILARASKQKNLVKSNDEILNWVNCLELFESIPSVQINRDIVFCSHKSSMSIKDDPTYKQYPKYHGKVRDVNKNAVVRDILLHVGIIDEVGDNNNSPSIDTLQQAETIKTKLLKEKFVLVEEEIIEEMRDLAVFFEKHGILSHQINVIWSTNPSCLFSGITKNSIIKHMEKSSNSYAKVNPLQKPNFYDYLLHDWVDMSKQPSKRKKIKSMTVSLERCSFKPMRSKLTGVFTHEEIKLFIEHLRLKLTPKLTLSSYIATTNESKK